MNDSERQSTGTATPESVSNKNAEGRLPDAACSAFAVMEATVKALAEGFEEVDVPVIVESKEPGVMLRLGGDINLSVWVGCRGSDSEQPDICVGVTERRLNLRNTEAWFRKRANDLRDPLIPSDPVAQAKLIN